MDPMFPSTTLITIAFSCTNKQGKNEKINSNPRYASLYLTKKKHFIPLNGYLECKVALDSSTQLHMLSNDFVL